MSARRDKIKAMSLFTAATGMDDRKKANKVAGQQESLINSQVEQAKKNQALAQQYLGPVLAALNKSAMGDPYDTESTNPAFWKYKSGFDHGADNAVSSLTDDFASRGLLNPADGSVQSGLGAGAANIRSGAENAFAGWRGDAIQEAIQKKMQLQQNMFGNAESLSIGANNEIGQGIGELGGVGAMYSSNADAALGNIKDLGTLIATHGASAGMGRGASAGNNTLGTNQKGTPKPIRYYTPPFSDAPPAANTWRYNPGSVA